MDLLKAKSQVTWYYFDDLDEADDFFRNTLMLEAVLDEGWAKIYRVADTAFVGAVDATKSSRNPVDANQSSHKPVVEHDSLFSLNIDNIEAWHAHIKASNMTEVTEIQDFPGAPVHTFFAKGPNGYHFEFQCFYREEDRKIFH